MAFTADLTAAFQETVVDVLIAKVKAAIRLTGIQHVVLAGGVAANRLLRERIAVEADLGPESLHMPPTGAICGHHTYFLRSLRPTRLDDWCESPLVKFHSQQYYTPNRAGLFNGFLTKPTAGTVGFMTVSGNTCGVPRIGRTQEVVRTLTSLFTFEKENLEGDDVHALAHDTLQLYTDMSERCRLMQRAVGTLSRLLKK